MTYDILDGKQDVTVSGFPFSLKDHEATHLCEFIKIGNTHSSTFRGLQRLHKYVWLIGTGGT